ncbi:MAG: hypothetical protein SGPRY_004219, partial [Prymnesium sp.]
HHHSAVWNALLYGKKLWSLLPPSNASFDPPHLHPLDSDWRHAWPTTRKRRKRGQQRRYYPSPGRLWCVQQPGMAIYLPAHWAHGTLAQEESLGVGGFLRDLDGLDLHMQVLHSPRGVGSLQNAVAMHREWYVQLKQAFPAGSE